ncbi:hypothetical protein Dimus_036698 [Dionaea muscipula]
MARETKTIRLTDDKASHRFAAESPSSEVPMGCSRSKFPPGVPRIFPIMPSCSSKDRERCSGKDERKSSCLAEVVAVLVDEEREEEARARGR